MSDEQDGDEALAGEEPRRRPRPPGGKRRSAADTEVMIGKINALLLHAVPRHDVIAVMKREHRLPERTCDKYIGICRKRWADNVADRETAKQRQINRLYAQMRALELEQNPKVRKHIEIFRRERLLAQIEGTLAPLQLTVQQEEWENLTPEQTRYIIENDGKLPPGVTAEMLFRKR